MTRTDVVRLSACAILVAATAIVVLAFLPAFVGAQGIVVEDAEWTSTDNLQTSPELAGVAAGVTPRIAVEYTEYVSRVNLQASAELAGIAAGVTPRIAVEYTEYVSRVNLQASAELAGVAAGVTPRIAVEYAEYVSTVTLQASAELAGVAAGVTPRIVVEYAESVLGDTMAQPFEPAPRVGQVILTQALNVGPPGPYLVGDNLTATFTVENKGDAEITLDKVMLAGRYGGGQLPGGGYPDFTYQTVTLEPGQPHSYSGTLNIPQNGDYSFFIAYYIENPTEAERVFLDDSNWNTCIDLDEGLTDADRTWQMTVGSDSISPGVVTNLAVSTGTVSSITLTWAAPGDDGHVGTASSYDIRYATSEVAEVTWDSSTQCNGEPAPLVAGTRQTFTVTGLSPGVKYYFALKAYDNVQNLSGLSNVDYGTIHPLAVEITQSTDRAIEALENIEREVVQSASEGNDFAQDLTAAQIKRILDVIFDGAGVAIDAFKMGDTLDLYKAHLGGSTYERLLWAKHAHGAILSDSMATLLKTMAESGGAAAYEAVKPAALQLTRSFLMYYAASAADAKIEDMVQGALTQALTLIAQSKGGMDAFAQYLKDDIQLFEGDLLAKQAEFFSPEVLHNPPSLAPEQLELYRRDLQGRKQANMVISNMLAREALPLHLAWQSLNVDPSGLSLGNFWVRFFLKSAATLAWDGPGAVAAGTALGVYDWFENTARMNLDQKMLTLAETACGDAFYSSTRIYLNALRGLRGIQDGTAPQVPDASSGLGGIENNALGYLHFGNTKLFVRDAYSEVTISNHDSHSALFELYSDYEETNLIGTEYTPIVTHVAQRIGAQKNIPIRVYYRKDNKYGDCPHQGNTIDFTLLCTTDAGVYYLGQGNTTWGTTRTDLSGDPWVSQEEIDQAEEMPYPIRSTVLYSLDSSDYELVLGIQNPFDQATSVVLQQQVPTQIQVLDAGGGTVAGDVISWYLTLGPQEAREVVISFATQEEVGTLIDIPAAVLSLTEPVSLITEDFPSNLSSLAVRLSLLAQGYPPNSALVGQEIAVPVSLANLLDDGSLTGSIALKVVDLEGNLLTSSSAAVNLDPTEVLETELAITADVSPGTWLIQGWWSDGATEVCFMNELITVYAGWDINRDWGVDYKDLAMLGAHYGETTSPPYPAWDINRDEVIDYKDLAMLGAHYGEVY